MTNFRNRQLQIATGILFLCSVFLGGCDNPTSTAQQESTKQETAKTKKTNKSEKQAEAAKDKQKSESASDEKGKAQKQSEQDPKGKKNKGKPKKDTKEHTIEIGKNWRQINKELEIWADLKAGHIMFSGHVCFNDGPLEMLSLIHI